MNWDAIGAVGQILGSLATFVTVGYLAVQVRQNNHAMRASARQALIDTFYDNLWELGTNAEIGSLVGRGLSNFAALSDEEKSRFNNLFARWEGNLFNGILLHRAGLLDEPTLNDIGDRFVASVRTTGGAAWFSSAYRNPVVDEYIEKRARQRPHAINLSEAFPYWVKDVGATGQ